MSYMPIVISVAYLQYLMYLKKNNRFQIQSELKWSVLTVFWCCAFPMFIFQFNLRGFAVIQMMAICLLEVARHVQI